MTTIIGSLLVFAPFFAFAIVLALAALGLMGIPVTAVVSAFAARREGLSVYRLSALGVFYSLLFFVPAIYFLLRLFGKNIPTTFVLCTYVILYFAWVCGISGVLLLFHIASENPPLASSILLAVNLATTAYSVWSLLEFKDANDSIHHIHIRYLLPFAIAWFNMSLSLLFVVDISPFSVYD